MRTHTFEEGDKVVVVFRDGPINGVVVEVPSDRRHNYVFVAHRDDIDEFPRVSCFHAEMIQPRPA